MRKISCKKIHFTTRKWAKLYIRQHRLITRGAMHVYKCEHCEGFHITSMSADKIRELKDNRIENSLIMDI